MIYDGIAFRFRVVQIDIVRECVLEQIIHVISALLSANCLLFHPCFFCVAFGKRLGPLQRAVENVVLLGYGFRFTRL